MFRQVRFYFFYTPEMFVCINARPKTYVFIYSVIKSIFCIWRNPFISIWSN